MFAERIVVRLLAAPLPEPIPMSFSSLTHRHMCLVEVHAAGLTGVGESWVNYPQWAGTERLATLLDGVAPLVLGQDVSDPGVTLDRLVAELTGIGRQWGAPGPIWQAISAVDLALWDLRSQHEGASLTQLLGGARTAAPVYASGVGPTNVPELCQEAVRRGIGAVKAKVGFGDETDRATIAAIRQHAPQAQIFADANCAWTPHEAAEQARVLRDEGVSWLEEPLAEPTPQALADLAATTSMPVAAGENVYGLADLAELAAVPGLAHIQPDPAKSGGVTTAARLAPLLDSGTQLSPHWYAGAIGLRAALALTTGLARAGWIELDLRVNPLRDGLVTEGFPLAGGRMVARTAPGLVPDLDHDRIAFYEQTAAQRSTP